ncbi:PEP-CTERM sorting domain-containing protein [Cerasicoccus fimbriatus]|uniref:PEP-CTERM sorting domain-containing protein n=1 Tax=Cerasicoccus fimbriatus TaxID=3014554 RepID=UPI0022B3996F|nr:PEP-CTERM sorting domain-containing protein [Cerasicoccus sp. TK19100]
MKKIHYLAMSAISSVAFTSSLSAAVVGTDNASATAYSGGWLDGTDGSITGPGAYGIWFLNPGADITHEVASVSSLSGNPPSLDTGGVSFRMLGNGAEATAFRFIDPAGLSVGQSFSIDLAVNFRGGNKGIDMRGSGEATIFNFNIGGDDYTVNGAATGNGSIGSAYSDDTLFTLTFEQTSGSGGNWSIARSGGVTDLDSGTYTGIATSFKLYANAGGSNEDALFINNLATVPEPGQYALLFGMGMLGLAFLRRR